MEFEISHFEYGLFEFQNWALIYLANCTPSLEVKEHEGGKVKIL